MTTIDWAVQGLSCALCVALLTEWWRDDARASIASRYMLVAMAVVAMAASCVWIGRIGGATDQRLADDTAINAEWQRRLHLSETLPPDIAAGLAHASATPTVFGRATLDSVRLGILTGRSVFCLEGLWLVGLLAAFIPAPGRRRTDPHAERHADPDEN